MTDDLPGDTIGDRIPDRVGERKDEHVRLADEFGAAERRNDFDDVAFLHHALAETSRDAVDLAPRLTRLDWPVPLYINAMTGGSDRTGRVNAELATVAQAVGLPIASGSQSAALRDPDAAASFTVLRERNPDGFLLANVGAGASVDDARRAIDMLRADALQVHLNVAQEVVMPEGDRDFSGRLDGIGAIVEAVDVPVVVKEVGFGLSRRTIQQLLGVGVRTVDVSGAGGTNFVEIENARRDNDDFGYLSGWGQSAVACLLDAADLGDRVELLASGGVRTPLDVARALALGARAVGLSGGVLRPLLSRGADSVTESLRDWLAQLADITALLGHTSVAGLADTDVLLTGRVREFCDLRGIDARAYATRTGRA